MFYSDIYRRDYDIHAISLMLLFAGANPGTDCEVIESAKPIVKIWLDGLLQAQRMIKIIFDDPDLEKTVASFIFQEQYLRNALQF